MSAIPKNFIRMLNTAVEENEQVELAIIAHCPDFDPNGPGTCADRLCAAVAKLAQRMNYAKVLLNNASNLMEGEPPDVKKRVDAEVNQMMDVLPYNEGSKDVHGMANAYVCVEPYNNKMALSIYPNCGGWIGADKVDLRADVAPFSD